MKSSFLVSFVVALAMCGVIYFALDFSLMKAQGLSLFFHH